MERWFTLLTQRQLRRGVHRSTKELKAAINDYIDRHNRDPKPFIWHKTADQIPDSVARFCKQINDSGLETQLSTVTAANFILVRFVIRCRELAPPRGYLLLANGEVL